MQRLYAIVKALLGGLMAKFVDRTGQKFSRLTVLFRNGTNHYKKVMWRCLCECGKETDVIAGALVTGNTTSCGCALKEVITKHGGTNKGSYNTWRAMMRRCYKQQDKDYARYGAKGVSVCDRWHEYLNFAIDMGEPSGDETLDRIDVYGNYNPNNCRWAGVKTQNRNVRVRATSKTGITGVTQTISGTFMAKVTVSKKSFYSKCYKTIEEAIAARKELERLHWGAA